MGLVKSQREKLFSSHRHEVLILIASFVASLGAFQPPNLRGLPISMAQTGFQRLRKSGPSGSSFEAMLLGRRGEGFFLLCSLDGVFAQVML